MKFSSAHFDKQSTVMTMLGQGEHKTDSATANTRATHPHNATGGLFGARQALFANNPPHYTHRVGALCISPLSWAPAPPECSVLKDEMQTASIPSAPGWL